MVQEGSDFCPHCGRTMTDADHITEQEFQASVAPRHSFLPIVMLICCVMLLLPAIMGMFMPHPDGPDYGPMDRTVEWDMYDYKDFGPTSEPIHFEITYTVNEDELKTANGSRLPRDGSWLAEPDAEGHHAVREYAVVGSTVTALAQTLWHTYSEFVASNPAYNTAPYFADYLLSFVEHAVVYTGDDVQFGKEEYWSYPVETLYTQKGDCEDSSLLLCALYGAMTCLPLAEGCEFAPADYIKGTCCFGMPGHMMAGVMLSEEVVRTSGDGVFSSVGDGNVYYLCETTGEPQLEKNPTMFVIGEASRDCSLASTCFYPGFVNTYLTQ